STLPLAKAASLGRERVRPLAWCSRPRSSAALLEGASAPSSTTCRLLARDHAAPEPTLALAKAASLGRERVRPLAWCSRPRSSAASLEGARMGEREREEHPADLRPGTPGVPRGRVRHPRERMLI